MARVLNNIPGIEQFFVEKSDTTNLEKKWATWKDDFNLFVVASGITNNEQKKALLLHMAGKEVKEIYRSSNSANVEENFDAIIGRLDAYFVPNKNLSYERYVFKKAQQLSTEDSTTYITRLRTLADCCEYSEMENEISDHFVATCRSNKLRKTLLREQNLILTKLQEISRNEEAANWQASDVEHEKLKDPVNKLSKPFYKGKDAHSDKKCFKCGDNFHKGHLKNCKAEGKTCCKCGKTGHLR